MKKTTIKIFSPDISLLGEIDLFNSLIFNRSYSDIESDFQLITEVTVKNINLLKKNNLIMINNDNEKVGIIRHSKIDLTEDGKEILLVKGFSIDNILNNRIVYISNNESETKFAGTDVDLIEKLINENFINPVDVDRRIDNLVLDIDKSLGVDILWQINSNKFVGDTITEVCKSTNLGYKIYLDFNIKKLVLTLYKGHDLSDRVVFNPALDNIKNMRYTHSNIDYKNTLYIQTTNKNAITINNYSIDKINKGVDRFEGFYNQGEINADESFEDVIEQYFNNNQLVESIEGDIISTSLFTYKKDFNIGDVVTVRNKKWGISKDLRITNETNIYESNPRITFTFGEPAPTLARKIKNYITNIRN